MLQNRTGIAVAVCIVWTGELSSQVHSALRDPEGSVFASFPEADGFRPIVRSVGRKARSAVQERLPFKIHFNELGDHTVYAAFRGIQPMGLIHARTEEGRWGLIEIEWSLALDLTIRGLKFHRCRSTHRRAVEESTFARSLIGLDIHQLSRLIDAKGRVKAEPGVLPRGGEELSATLVKSAIKTLILTDTVWRADLDRLRELSLGLRAFPEGKVVRRLLPPKGVKPGRTEAIRDVRALLVRDGRGRALGRVVATELAWEGKELRLEWTLTLDGRIRQIESEREWPDARTRTEFRRLEGRTIKSVEAWAGEAKKIAADLTTIVAEMREPGAR